jgi:hypothetical protein
LLKKKAWTPDQVRRDGGGEADFPAFLEPGLWEKKSFSVIPKKA